MSKNEKKCLYCQFQYYKNKTLIFTCIIYNRILFEVKMNKKIGDEFKDLNLIEIFNLKLHI